MKPRVVQINVSAGGLPKKRILEADVGRLGITGDQHRFYLHGGPQKALLLLASEVIDQLKVEGWPLIYGALGENITTVGLDHKQWRAGHRYRINNILVELTQPRTPCAKLNPYGSGIQKRIFDAQVRALDPASLRWGESGFYAAVIEPGFITTDDAILAYAAPVTPPRQSRDEPSPRL